MNTIDPSKVATDTPTAQAVHDALRYMRNAQRTVDYQRHDGSIIAAMSPIPNDESGSVEVAYGTHHVNAFVSLAETLRHNDLANSVRTESHADYPHEHGYLVGCGGCEAQCNGCTEHEGWAECVWPGHQASEPVAHCPACGEPIDYCSGHGSGTMGAWVLSLHDDGDHSECHILGCIDKCPEFHEDGSCIHSAHMMQAGR